VENKIDKMFENANMIFAIRLIMMNFAPVFFLIAILFLDWDIYNIIIGIYIISVLIFNYIILRKTRKNIKKLKKLIYGNVENFQNELNEAIYINYKEYILTPNYIIDLRCYKIIKYEDIKYICYQHKRSLTSKDIPLVLTIITNEEQVSLRVWSGYHLGEYYENLEDLIKNKNSNIIKCKKKHIKKI